MTGWIHPKEGDCFVASGEVHSKPACAARENVVSLPSQKGVGTLGEQLAPGYGVTFSLPLVHPSGEREQMATMVPLFEASQLKTHLEAVFPLHDVAKAHQLIAGGHVRGKLVLTIT